MKNAHILITKEDSILNVLKKMDATGHKLMIVAEGSKFVSVVSIGDIQRAIIGNIDLQTPVVQILRKDITVASAEENPDHVKARMKERRNELMPVVDAENNLVDVIFWADLFKESFDAQEKTIINLPVVIMAGGFGSRLKPLTNVVPKPLIPIGKKTIIEEIIHRFEQYRCHEFHISVNYKADLIEYYLNQLQLKSSLRFFREDKPLGTAGSLVMLKNILQETFFISNCDILIDQDYSEILAYHREQKNKITLVAAMKHLPVAYGTIETAENGQLKKFNEKPELTFKINTGMYILEPELLQLIPENSFYHITELIDNVVTMGDSVGVFPVSEKSWVDIGTWDEYLKFIQ